MFARDLITDTIPQANPKDTVARVLNWMSDFRVSHVPYVQKGELLGLVSEEELLELEDDEIMIGEIQLALPDTVFVSEDDHYYDVLKQASIHNLDVLPVVTRGTRNYLGAVTRKDMVNNAAVVLAAQEHGGIIVLEVDFNSYTLSEISRLCESADAKVLSLTVTNAAKPQTLYVTLKLNIRELSRLIATLERFNYDVAFTFTDIEQLDDTRDRYENFLRYLNT